MAERKEPPAVSLQRVCKKLDEALKGNFKHKKGFPRFKKRGVSKESFYVTNQTIRVVEGGVFLPKLGKVKCRRREGIKLLNLEYVGQALPERTDSPSTPVEIPLLGQGDYPLPGTGPGSRNLLPSTSEVE
mgnify:CR=1 FL=1